MVANPAAVVALAFWIIPLPNGFPGTLLQNMLHTPAHVSQLAPIPAIARFALVMVKVTWYAPAPESVMSNDVCIVACTTVPDGNPLTPLAAVYAEAPKVMLPEEKTDPEAKFPSAEVQTGQGMEFIVSMPLTSPWRTETFSTKTVFDGAVAAMYTSPASERNVASPGAEIVPLPLALTDVFCTHALPSHRSVASTVVPTGRLPPDGTGGYGCKLIVLTPLMSLFCSVFTPMDPIC